LSWPDALNKRIGRIGRPADAASRQIGAYLSPPHKETTMRSPALFKLIGNTPLVEITRLDTGPCQLFLKLESQNPGGSIKDRIGLSMIEAAEADGGSSPAAPSSKRPPATPASAWRWSAASRATACCWSCPTRCRPKKCCT
jgi:hypothetical protein